MRPNNKVQELYRIHTKHIPRDTVHLGDAETLEDVFELINIVKPNVYMLAECCTDHEPTLQLATWEVVRRVRLNLLSTMEREKIVTELNKRGVLYRKTSYLPLNSDFTETAKCKIQKHFSFIYELLFRINKLLRERKFSITSDNKGYEAQEIWHKK